MVDQSIVQSVHADIRQAIDEHNTELEKEIITSQRLHADNGMLNSGVFIIAIQTLCADACSARARFIWDILRQHIERAHTTYEEGLSQQLKDIVQYHLAEEIKGLEHLIQEDATLIGNFDLMSTIPDEISNTRRVEQDRIFSEIDLFVTALKNNQPTPFVAAPEKITGYSPAPETASHSDTVSIKNVNQQIIEQSGYDTTNILNTILQELRSIDVLVKYDKSEIISLIDEVKIELKRNNPNFAKLQSYLSTIGNAVGSTAQIATNLRTSYVSLKTLAQSFNVNLP